MQNGRDLAPVILVIAFIQFLIVQEPVPNLTGKINSLGFFIL